MIALLIYWLVGWFGGPEVIFRFHDWPVCELFKLFFKKNESFFVFCVILIGFFFGGKIFYFFFFWAGVCYGLAVESEMRKSREKIDMVWIRYISVMRVE